MPLFNCQKCMEFTQEVAKGELSQVMSLTDIDNEDNKKMITERNQLVLNLGKTIHFLKSSSSDNAEVLFTKACQIKNTTDMLLKMSDENKLTTINVSDTIKSIKNLSEEASTNINQVYLLSEDTARCQVVIENSASQISTSMSGIVQETDELTNAFHLVAAAIEELSTSVKDVSVNSNHAALIAIEAEKQANNANSAVDALKHSASEINQIIDIIKEIASQTNLLALNATIEAASAGEAGKGFAVVANEVKELAKQSAEASENIRKKIEAIHDKTSTAAEAISSIGTVNQELSQISQIIARTTEQQTSAVNEINHTACEALKASAKMSESVSSSAQQINVVANQAKQANTNVKHIVNYLEELTSKADDISLNTTNAINHFNEVVQSSSQITESVFMMGVGVESLLEYVKKHTKKMQSTSLKDIEYLQIEQLDSNSEDSVEELIAWNNDEYSVGHEFIDLQHKRLVYLINTLHCKIQIGEEKIIIEAILEQLVEYTKTHFSDEERLLKEVNYDDFDAHQKIHQTFAAQAKSILDDYKAGKVIVMTDILAILKDWLINHIQGTDKKYIPYLSKKEIGIKNNISTNTLIQWSEKYSVQHEFIDRQHKRLIQLINDLYFKMQVGEGKGAIGKTLRELVDYTQTHFSDEEKLMKAADFDDFDMHQKIHQKFTLQVKEVLADYESGKGVVTMDIMDLLKDWLINHIQGSDKKYVPFLKTLK